jgi:hypothetical protein
MTSTALPTGGDLDVALDLQAMVDQILACQYEECLAPATHRMTLYPTTCSHTSSAVYCAPHVARGKMIVGSWVIWTCMICNASGVAGEIVITRL